LRIASLRNYLACAVCQVSQLAPFAVARSIGNQVKPHWTRTADFANLSTADRLFPRQVPPSHRAMLSDRHQDGQGNMSERLHFEDIQIGARWTSLARTITETDVVNFAGMTGDYDPLHVDHEYARQTPFGKPIAHGLLGLSLVAGLASQCPAVRTMAFVKIDKWEFLKPIYIGDTVHAETEVLEKSARGRRSGQVVWRRQLVNQHGEVVQSGEFCTIVALACGQRRTQESSGLERIADHEQPSIPLKRAAG
jgi:acyl dehydratase